MAATLKIVSAFKSLYNIRKEAYLLTAKHIFDPLQNDDVQVAQRQDDMKKIIVDLKLWWLIWPCLRNEGWERIRKEKRRGET